MAKSRSSELRSRLGLRSRFRRRPARRLPAPWRSPWARAFWNRAYKENVTGQAAMIAYNLILAVFFFTLLVLFIVGQVIRSPDVEMSILNDLERLFPNTETDVLQRVLNRIRENSTTLGIAAIVGGLWIGASFWGAVDTAFARIYHVPSRTWLEQKRWSLLMLLVVTLFIAASVAIPALEGAVISTTDKLPLGLSDIGWLANAVLILSVLIGTFGVCCVIYWATPKKHPPWHAVWPGALFLSVGVGIANWVFPFYLTNISDLSRLGGTLGFVLVALIWFYLLSLGLLAGAVINSLRHELDDTGRLPVEG